MFAACPRKVRQLVKALNGLGLSFKAAREATGGIGCCIMHKYHLIIRWSDEDQVWIGTCPELFHGGVHAGTAELALSEMRDVVDEMVQNSRELPAPRSIARSMTSAKKKASSAQMVRKAVAPEESNIIRAGAPWPEKYLFRQESHALR
jgi:predicted RNase H-like HicB family nuclease